MAHEDYYAALRRLVEGNPERVPKGTRITNDAVSLEAGKGKGSIKKSRSQFADLIAAIDSAAAAQKQSPSDKLASKLATAEEAATNYQALWESALAREESLVAELIALKQKLRELDGSNVIPIRQAASLQEAADAGTRCPS